VLVAHFRQSRESRFDSLTSSTARDTECTIIRIGRPYSLSTTERLSSWRTWRWPRRDNVDDQGRSVQRVRTFCFRKDDDHCLDRGECDHSKPRRESRAERI